MKHPVEILQVLCILSVMTGVTIEFIYGAHLGFICITLGGLFFAVAEKINRYRTIKKFNNTNNKKGA
jgi:hypothetical protein